MLVSNEKRTIKLTCRIFLIDGPTFLKQRYCVTIYKIITSKRNVLNLHIKNVETFFPDITLYLRLLQVCFLLTSVIASLIAVGCYQVYISIIMTPELPKFDLDVWWGSNVTKVQDTSIRPFRVVYSDAVSLCQSINFSCIHIM